jgi:hypothetical protein
MFPEFRKREMNTLMASANSAQLIARHGGTHQPMPTRVSNRERTRWRDPERQSFDGIKVSAATRSERDDSILPDLLNCL